MNQKSSGDGRQGERGVALVIVLSFVVLLTVAVVAYFTRTMSNRQVANDSLNASRTEQLARGALDQIVSDFKQEIVNGSKVTANNGTNTYYPISADGTALLRANMLPQRSGNPAIATGQPDPIPNLVRISNHNDASVVPSLTAPMVGSRASNCLSTTPSLNGRVISLARWNQHYLIPQADPAGSKPDPTTKFTAPDWVMMTQEKGPTALSSPTKDASGNAVTVTGRYAYAVYDEGGLLDANVAGFPSGATSSQIGYKSSLGMTDLPTALANATPAVTLSPTVADKLVGWRNYATTKPENIFPNNNFASNLSSGSDPAVQYFIGLQKNSSGFTRTGNAFWNGRTDQAFLSRQQLLEFQRSLQQTTPGSFPASALQHLGTFSRELNAPSWGPSYDATELGGTTNTYAYSPNASTAYRTNRDNASSINRLLPGVRYTSLSGGSGTVTSYGVDGKPFTYGVRNGDPLVQRRFPLGRLYWIGPDGPRQPVGSDVSMDDLKAAIRKNFGLVWRASRDEGLIKANGSVNTWTYVGSVGTSDIDPALGSINTLDQIARESAPREPNYFELLHAGMLSGSIGWDPGWNPATSSDSYVWYTAPAQWNEYDVFRVGASIITQSQQADSTFPVCYPTVVEYARSGVAVLAVGVDDLPYINLVGFVGGRNSTNSVAVYGMITLWNPHQTVGDAARPPVRVCVGGQGVLLNEYVPDSNPKVLDPVSGALHGGYIYKISDWDSTSPQDAVKTLRLKTDTASTGVNGFNDPHAITFADVQAGDLRTDITEGTTTTAGWTQLSEINLINNVKYVGIRLPDFIYDPTKVSNYDPNLESLSAVVPAPAAYTNYALAKNYYAWLQFATSKSLGRNSFNAWMEFQNPQGKWIPYSYFSNIDHASAGNNNIRTFMEFMGSGSKEILPSTNPKAYQADVASPKAVDPPPETPAVSILYYTHYNFLNSDPTTIRTVYCLGQPPSTKADWHKVLTTSLSCAETELYTAVPPPKDRPGVQWAPKLVSTGGGRLAPSGFARNNSTAPSADYTTYAAYVDPDGIQRIADSGLYPASSPANSIAWQGDPYATSVTRVADRPLIFHRPYTNVGELGYISRNYPWRTLDFFTRTSGDSALLDLFTVSSNTGTVSAGRINLNTRNFGALLAMLKGTTAFSGPTTVTRPGDSHTPTALSKPLNIATKLTALTGSTATGGGPMINKEEIVTRFGWFKTDSGSPSAWTLSSGYPASSSPDFATTDEQNVKAQREAVTRAFAETGQTRTWNLLIDIVAQSGRYPSNVAQLKDFNVQGERHYWLHVAIDRFTGQVVDQQLEAVNE